VGLCAGSISDQEVEGALSSVPVERFNGLQRGTETAVINGVGEHQGHDRRCRLKRQYRGGDRTLPGLNNHLGRHFTGPNSVAGMHNIRQSEDEEGSSCGIERFQGYLAMYGSEYHTLQALNWMERACIGAREVGWGMRLEIAAVHQGLERVAT
jgi:hypothetical protein